MATVAPISTRWPLAPADTATPTRSVTTLPPQEAWPLLATIAITWLLMLAVIAWQAVPAVTIPGLAG